MEMVLFIQKSGAIIKSKVLDVGCGGERVTLALTNFLSRLVRQEADISIAGSAWPATPTYRLPGAI